MEERKKAIQATVHIVPSQYYEKINYIYKKSIRKTYLFNDSTNIY